MFSYFIIYFFIILSHKFVAIDLSTDEINDFKEIRKDCNWKLRNKISNANYDIQDCILLDVNFKEGKGILQLTRIGPFTTTGGIEPIIFVIPKIPAPKNSLMVISVFSPMDPYTETYFNYPPYHIHHLFSVNPHDQSNEQLHKSLSYLEETKGKKNSYPGTTSDRGCLDYKGGTDCLIDKLRYGFGYIPYFGIAELNVHIEDVRKENSPPLALIVECIEGFIINADTTSIKGTKGAFFEAKGAAPPNRTYKLKENVPSYNFETFYIPTKTIFTNDFAHSHWLDGDERWIVLGTASDLGIDPKYQDRLIISSDSIPYRSAIDINENVSNFKNVLEANLNSNQEKFNSKQHSLRFIKEKNLDYNENNKLLMHNQKPQLLCKYYGVTEHVNKNYVINSKKNFKELIGKLSAIQVASIKDPKFESQMNNMFIGIKEGKYYRKHLNSENDFKDNKQISSYQNCSYFEIEAGNYLTIIQFDKPRQKGESLDQHLIQPYQVHMPDIPIHMKTSDNGIIKD